MVAKKRSALVKLHEAIRNNHPKKIYLALGVGRLKTLLPVSKCWTACGLTVAAGNSAGFGMHAGLRRGVQTA
ncbi:pseudouridine synthase domain protein [Neisseria musculi]|uniref:Pseudouridine synthase domain protein n=1 Tax=Neisseria musculi TaxID=1815583 RepID=A0A7H1MDS1_9NEIS|nr:pseudouridine synthase domain protein [Neisseria musculi]